MLGCTLIISTFNRPNYLKRLLEFLDSFDIGLDILIADVSDIQYQLQNKNILNNYKSLNIGHMCLNPNIGPVRTMALATAHCTSPFVAYCHDDDFIFPDFIEEAIDFLLYNPDYVICNGRYSLSNNSGNFCLQSNKAYDSDDVLVRLEDSLSNMSPTHFAVWRRDIAIKHFTNTAIFTDFHDFQEPVYTCFCTLFGKVHVLDKLAIIHVTHGGNRFSKESEDQFVGNTIVSGSFSSDIILAVELMLPFILSYTDKSIWDIRDIFITSLLRYFAGYAFIFQGEMAAKLKNYPPKLTSNISACIHQTIREYFKINIVPNNSNPHYFRDAFQSCNKSITLELHNNYREAQIKLYSKNFDDWKNVIGDINFSNIYSTIKSQLVATIINDYPNNINIYRAFDFVFLSTFFNSISGSYIQSFEPVNYIYDKLNLNNPNSLQYQYKSRALDVLIRNTNPI